MLKCDIMHLFNRVGYIYHKTHYLRSSLIPYFGLHGTQEILHITAKCLRDKHSDSD